MKKKKTRYCKYYSQCDKDINCYEGEYCPVFEHSEDFSSLGFDEDTRYESQHDQSEQLNFDSDN